jgi:3,4-dihydroxy 2-butanone 4-phosphate synthase/GTP cyclohydrolase II
MSKPQRGAGKSSASTRAGQARKNGTATHAEAAGSRRSEAARERKLPELGEAEMAGVTERVERAIEDIRQGKMLILVDDEDRENEGDLTLAAEMVTPEAINFMAREGRGLICLTLDEERCDRLGLRPMVVENSSPYGTAFTVSIEARSGVTTGISAHDRAHTIKTALRDDVTPYDLVRPGHVFPLRARPGGVLQRAGQTEGSVDLARLAGLTSAGVICEIMNDDGTMARMPDLRVFAKKHGLRILTIADLIHYRLQRESLIERVEEVSLPISLGGTSQEMQARIYLSQVAAGQYVALTRGTITPDKPVLVRVHTACFPGDMLGSRACDCHAQLEAAIRKIDAEGCGVVLYLRPAMASWHTELVSHGLRHQVRRGTPVAAPASADDAKGRNQAAAFSLRDYGIGAQILRDVGVGKMRLMTNNPKKIVGLEAYGLEMVERVPLVVGATDDNVTVLRSKRDHGHLLGEAAEAGGGGQAAGSRRRRSQG